MRHLAAAVVLVLITTSTLSALDNTTYDLPCLFRNAQTIVIGRVVQLTEATAPDPGAEVRHAVLATIAVKEQLKGAPVPTLQLVLREQDGDQVRVGKELLMFLQSYDAQPPPFAVPWLSGHGYHHTFGQFHFPHPMAPVEGKWITISDELKGEYLRHVVGSSIDVDELRNLFALMSGPVLSVVPMPEPLPWVAPWTVTMRFSNPTTYPIPLRTCVGPDAPLNGKVVFIDQHGFAIGCGFMPLRLAGDGPTNPVVEIPAGGMVTGSLVFTASTMTKADSDSIKRIAVAYCPFAELPVLAAGWNGQIESALDVTFSPSATIQANKSARSSAHLLLSLDRETLASDQPVNDQTLFIALNPCRYDSQSGGGAVEEPTADERAALRDALQCEQAGAIVRPARHGSTLATLVSRVIKNQRHVSVRFTPAELSGLVPPGTYVVRLIVPDGDELSLSQTIQIVIP